MRKRLFGHPTVDSHTSPAVFLLLPQTPTNLTSSVTRHPMLDNGLTAVEGRLWFVGPLVNHGSSVSIESLSDADLFDDVTDTLGLGDVPAVILDPRLSTPALRHYPAGLDRLEDCSVLPAGGGMMLDAVFTWIDRVHETKLVTPDAQSSPGRLWEDAAKHWPVKLAEVTVQMYIVTALNIAFPWCRIIDEQPGISGRTDVEIEEIDYTSGQVIRHALIELKVLRDFGSTGISKSHAENLVWIEEGVEQAAAYAQERGTREYGLCCFDMRVAYTGQECFRHVIKKALALNVVLRSWHLFASAKEYRSFRSSQVEIGA